MRAHPTRVLSALRASLLVMLLLGLTGRPVLSQLTGVHAVEHAVLSVADHGHDHPDHDPAEGPDHAKGSHSLKHQADAGSSACLLPGAALAAAVPPAPALPAPDASSVRPRQPTSPFRPPIA